MLGFVLVAAVSEGGVDSNEFFARATLGVATVLTAFGIPEAEIPDLIQDVFVVFLAKRSEIASPMAWLYSAARHRSRQYWGLRRRAAFYSIEDLLPIEVPGQTEASRAVLRIDCRRALDELPDRARSVVEMHYWAGLNPHEIAAATGLAATSVDSTKRRSLSRIKRKLSPAYGHP